jgi:hypothetical protein
MTRDDAVEKIRKLLRLARDKGASEAEAATALAMAQKLMMMHDIENVEEKVEELAVLGNWHDFAVDKRWAGMLASAVAKLYSCRMAVMRKSRKVQFVGKASHVLVCVDTLQWVNEQVEELYQQARRAFRQEHGSFTKQQSKDWRLSFKEACATRIWHRVNEIVAKARNEIPSHMALVVIDQALAAADDLIKDYRSSRALASHHGAGSGAGYRAGDQVKLQHGVNKQ